jgi:hypothetical protein
VGGGEVVEPRPFGPESFERSELLLEPVEPAPRLVGRDQLPVELGECLAGRVHPMLGQAEIGLQGRHLLPLLLQLLPARRGFGSALLGQLLGADSRLLLRLRLCQALPGGGFGRVQLDGIGELRFQRLQGRLEGQAGLAQQICHAGARPAPGRRALRRPVAIPAKQLAVK